MSNWLKIPSRLILLLAVFYGLNSWYTSSRLYKDYLEKEADMLIRLEKTKGQQVLYFSASSNFGFNNIDTDKRRISSFIADYFPNVSFGPVDKGAVHAGVFRSLIERIPKDGPTKTIIVAMNLRSFGPGWINSKLETSLMKSNVMYHNRPAMVNRFLVSLNHYDNISWEEREQITMAIRDTTPLPFPPPRNTVTSWCRLDKWGDWRDPKRQMADHFIKNFGFVLDSNNPRIKDFDAIVNIAKEKNLNLIFNILAENIELADSLTGKEITYLMKQNADFLVNRYHKNGVIVVNNLEKVPNSDFLEEGFPTEHYFQDGRKIIAQNVAYALRHHYPDQFTKPN